MIDSINEALIVCIKALGGSKQVAPLLWPEKTPDSAQRLLLDCLNDDRPARLTPEQLIFVLRLSRRAGCHAGIEFICAHLSYAAPTPIEPRDEADELRRQFIESTKTLARLAERIERLDLLDRPGLRSA